jgi:hypothetical protein
MKPTLRLFLAAAFVACLSSCSTSKAPDPFDLMMLEAAKEMFKPNAQ